MALPPRTRLVANIRQQASTQAERPLDVARRVGAGLGGGIAVGLVVATMGMPGHADTTRALMIGFIFIVACAIPWFMRPKRAGEPVPVVARTLGTDEPVRTRLVGGRGGALVVPVVARPLDGSRDFLTIVALTDVDSENPADPPVGSLYALQQAEREFGELENIDEVTPRQLEVIEDLRAHPKKLSNTAEVLPIRAGSMERHTTRSQVEFWGGIVSGVLVGLALAWFTA